MKNPFTFKIYCLEMYRQEKGMAGNVVLNLFNKYGIMKDLEEHYETLMLTDEEYILEFIDILLKRRGVNIDEFK